MAGGRWWDEDWAFRAIVYVQNNSADTTFDIEIVLTSVNTHFWENIQSDGDDIRVVSAYGVLLTYDIASFDYANKTVTIEVDNFSGSASKCNVLYVYYGNANAAAAITGFSPSTPKTGTMSAPVDPTVGTILKAAVREQPGATRPTAEVAKASSEQVLVYFDITDWLQTCAVAIEGSMNLEGIVWASMDVQQGAATQASMFTNVATVYPFEHRDRVYIAAFVKAGSTANNYTIIVQWLTTLANLYEARALLKVYDVSEA